jgi:hypothetical protein
MPQPFCCDTSAELTISGNTFRSQIYRQTRLARCLRISKTNEERGEVLTWLLSWFWESRPCWHFSACPRRSNNWRVSLLVGRRRQARRKRLQPTSPLACPGRGYSDSNHRFHIGIPIKRAPSYSFSEVTGGCEERPQTTTQEPPGFGNEVTLVSYAILGIIAAVTFLCMSEMSAASRPSTGKSSVWKR